MPLNAPELRTGAGLLLLVVCAACARPTSPLELDAGGAVEDASAPPEAADADAGPPDLGAVTCFDNTSCPPSPQACYAARCQGGFCVESPITGPSPGPDPVPGDCRSLSCQQGQAQMSVDRSDRPEDEDRLDCFEPACGDDGAVLMRPVAGGRDCVSAEGAVGRCDAAGECVPTEAIYVDGVRGDDDAPGDAPRDRAVATLTRALDLAGGRPTVIRVAPGTYRDEVFPLLLADQQRLLCSAGVLIEGEGSLGSANTAIVRLRGEGAAIIGCHFRGVERVERRPTTYCLQSESPDALIEAVRVESCLNAVFMRRGFTRVVDSVLVDHQLNSVFVYGGSGELVGNVVETVGRHVNSKDISCNGEGPEGVSGSGNRRPDGAPIDCRGCRRCPFE